MWQYNYLCHSNDAYLSHHGILGQKWGVRRYQYSDGSLTPAGRRRYRVNEKGDLVRKTKAEIASDRKIARKESIEKKRQVRLERENETEEKKKERIAKSRDPKKIYDNKDLFDYKELLDLYNIMNVEKNIKGLIPKKVSTGEKYVKAMGGLQKALNTTGGMIEGGTKTYNAIARIINANAGEQALPIVETGGGKKKKKKKESNDDDDD